MRAFILAVTGLALAVAACSSYGTSVVEVENQAQVASVVIALPSPSLVAGQTQRANVTLKDANGVAVTGRAVEWFSSAASVASVDNSGVIQGVAPGAATVSAVSEGVAGQAALTVIPRPPIPVAKVLLSINPAAVVVGQTAQATVALQDSSGNPLTDRPVTWQSGNPNVASVSGNGDISAVSPGTATITAASEGITASASLTVNAPAPVPVATISVSPASSSVQVGATVQLSATTRDANGNVLTGRAVTWSSANAGIAAVNSSGFVTVVAQGSTTITATSETKTGTASITGSVSTGAGWRGREPAGMTFITDQPFNSLPSNGWTGYFNFGLASDATAPHSPSGVFENVYPAGWAGGGNPGLAEASFNNYRTLYVSMYVKYSSNWQGHSSGVNKIIHLWVGGLNHLMIIGGGSGGGGLKAEIRMQGIAGGGNFDGGTAGIYNSSVQFVRGQWHMVEMVAVSNTSSNLDGSVSLYVDGALAASASGIAFEGGGPRFNMAKLDPTWGGMGDTVMNTMSFRVDHIFMSGKN